MNRGIYRLVWNRARARWVVASELARSHSRGSRAAVVAALAGSLVLVHPAFAQNVGTAGGDGAGTVGGVGAGEGLQPGGGGPQFGSGIGGGNGGNGGPSPISGGGGGGAGSGGGGGAATNLSSGTGGFNGGINGGAGGTDTIFGDFGGGGGGGGGTAQTTGANLTLPGGSTWTGGAGGAGAGGSGAIGGGGGGGGGGIGVRVNGNSLLTIGAGAVVTGGAGGAGGAGWTGGSGGGGGGGGQGVVLDGDILNLGTIQGGSGGAGGAGSSNSVFSGPAGAQGRGGEGILVLGSGRIVTNEGVIAGGLAADGTTRANAITATGGDFTLEVHGGSSIIGNVNAGGDGRLSLVGATNAAFDVSSIGTQYQGFGVFVKTGTATWTLSGMTTAQTPWTISGGILAISADGNLGDAAGGITFGGGRLRLDASVNSARTITLNAGGGTVDTNGNSVTLSGVMSGTGGLTKIGTGTLTLTGANNYSGGTTIAAGALQGNTTSLQGAITNNAAVVFDQATSGTYAGAMDGTGTLTKLNTGTLILSGANTFSGVTTVNAGTLAVNGSITSVTTVNSGGTLGGTGTVGSVSVMGGGVYAPGNSIGIQTVNGSLTFAAGSIFRVETDAAGNADRVNVVGAPGTVTINGGTVDVQAGAGTYQRNTSYTILTSTGATTGQFTAVTSNLAFLTPSLIYAPNSVMLNLASSAVQSYASVAQTGNQTRVANYLDSFANNPGSAAGLIQQIDNLSAPQARTAFDGLSGSSHAAASQISGAIGRAVSAAVMGRADAGGKADGTRAEFRGVQYARLEIESFGMPVRTMTDAPLQLAQGVPMGGGAISKAAAGEAGFWGQVLGTGGKIGSNGNGPDSSYHAAGFVAGIDATLNPEWLLGGALSYTPTHWDSDVNGDSKSHGTIKTPMGALYARYASGPWQLRLNGAFANPKFETKRDVTIGMATTKASSNHRGQEWSAAGELEYVIPMGGWELRPLAGLRYAKLHENDFNENGTNALSVNSRNTAATNAAAGARVLIPFAERGGWEFRAAYSHLFGDNDSPVSARLAGQPASFTVNGTPLKRDALNLGAGVAGTFSKNVNGFVDTSYEARGDGQHAYAVSAGLRILW